MLSVLRRLAHGCEAGALPVRQLGAGHEAGRAEVLATIRAFLAIMACTARRRIRVAPPGWLALTTDEQRILSLVASAQRGDESRLETLAMWSATPDSRLALTSAVRGLAATLAACRMPVSLHAAGAPAADRFRDIDPVIPTG